MNVCTNLHNNSSSSCWDALVWTKSSGPTLLRLQRNTSTVAKTQLAYFILQHSDFTQRLQLNCTNLHPSALLLPTFQHILGWHEADYTRYCQEVWKYSLTRPHGAASFGFDALPRRHFSHWYSDGRRTDRDTITQHDVTKWYSTTKLVILF